jgi:uncharacterized protein YqgC (DUF456 family)
MLWLYYILLILVLFAGLALVFVTLPGLWIMTAAAAIYTFAPHEHRLGHKTLLTLVLLSVIGEILEFTAGGAAARKAGGGRRAAIGALVGGIAGGIVGSFLLPLVLTIVGICIGSFVGAAAFELLGGGEAIHSLGVGWGAAKGRLVGVFLKLGIGIIMAILILITAFP